jgi:hypothetical protein
MSGTAAEPHPRTRVPRRAIVLVVYVAVAVAWTYGVLDRGTISEHIGYVAEAFGVLVVYAAFGFGLASWFALLLPVVTFLIELPANDNPALPGDVTWVPFDAIYFAPFALVGAALGVGVAKAARRPG